MVPQTEKGKFMLLYVTRHGETDYNIEKRYTGSTDIPLNSKGLLQAHKLAVNLSSVPFDIIISSPLLRTKQTAEIINKSFDVPIVIMNEFSEINVGIYEGLTKEEAQDKYPETWEKIAKIYRDSGVRPIDYAPANGETLRQFDSRIANGLNKLKSDYIDKKILLVCHAFTAKIINRQIKNLSFVDMDTFTLGNCEFVEYIFADA